MTTGPLEGSIDRDGLRIHYLDWPGVGPLAAVLVHGGGQTAHTWDRVAARLAPGIRCLAVDLRGHGDSSWSPGGRYALADHVADLGSAIDELRLGAHVLVGTSLGASVALGLAATRPAALAGLVLVDGGPRVVERDGSARIRSLLREPSEAATIDELVDQALARNPRRRRAELRRSIVHSVRMTDRGTWTWKHDPRAFRAHSAANGAAGRARRQELLWAWVEEVTCPVLLVRGGASDVVLEADVQALARRMPSAERATVPGAGHSVQGDRPAALARLLEQFIGRLATAAGAPRSPG